MVLARLIHTTPTLRHTLARPGPPAGGPVVRHRFRVPEIRTTLAFVTVFKVRT